MPVSAACVCVPQESRPISDILRIGSCHNPNRVPLGPGTDFPEGTTEKRLEVRLDSEALEFGSGGGIREQPPAAKATQPPTSGL